MRRRFFQVGDSGPRQVTTSPGTPDFDRSATFDLWFRANNLTHNQVLLESGDAGKGLSLTLGDADGNGSFNDLRFRVLGANGESLTATAPINALANPVTDFIHAAAVFSDNDNNRYVELYINGALAMRVDGVAAPTHTHNWDGWDQAGLGKSAGTGIGGNGGTGLLPFNGGFTGQMAAVGFWNQALAGGAIAGNYNAMLDPVSFGVRNASGGALSPAARPTNVSLGAAESNSLQVIQERQHKLAAALAVDAVVGAGGTLTPSSSAFSPGTLPTGTEFISYLLHFDPVGAPGGVKTATGSIEFGNPIVGLVTNANLLGSTDSVLGSIGKYGLVADRGVQLAGSDFIAISSDRRTLSFSLTVAADDVAEFRVLTQGAIVADFDGDGLVSGSDLAVWKSAVGKSGAADADGDGDSDGADLLSWQRRVGAASSSTIAFSAVPEPGGATLVTVAAMLWAASRRGRGAAGR
jgi:hypothetical protein